MKVAIGDDSMLIREGLARLLNDAGCEVVATAADALTLEMLLPKAQPDAVVLDIRMPPDLHHGGDRGRTCDPCRIPLHGSTCPVPVP